MKKPIRELLIRVLIAMFVAFPIILIAKLISDTFLSGAIAGMIFITIMNSIDIEIHS